MSRHRSQAIRPRYARIAAVCASVLVTLTAVLGGVGVLPTGGQHATAVAASVSVPEQPKDKSVQPGNSASAPVKEIAPTTIIPVDPAATPAQSGEGKRVLFSQEEQRVWLVDADNDVQRTYLVSGSVYDNLDPGTYAVYSRSEKAWGIDDSGTMNWFVRFAHGPNAAIGFHDIPVDDGQQIQTPAELGTPQSHGCIRQRTADALALWDFAPIGTTVVVI